MTIELSECVIDAIADAVAKKIQIPKTAHWVTRFHGFPPEPTTVCSECGFDRDFYIHTRGFEKINYCPRCGLKMWGKND